MTPEEHLPTVEEHPLEPFLPANARILFLGSFPPPKQRWSMDFFYPNWINDFWRVQGLIHFGDEHHFEATSEHRFDRARIIAFCESEGLAFFDTARKVRRLKGNADDNFLEVVEQTDVFALLRQLPECRTVVTTGGKASEELQAYFADRGLDVAVPKVGENVRLNVPSGRVMAAGGALTAAARAITWWRMPSTSRAYPMKLSRKAEYYSRLFASDWRKLPITELKRHA